MTYPASLTKTATAGDAGLNCARADGDLNVASDHGVRMVPNDDVRGHPLVPPCDYAASLAFQVNATKAIRWEQGSAEDITTTLR